MEKVTDTTENIKNDVTDIDLSSIKKKRFRIDGDDSKILELNTSDVGLLARLDSVYPKLMEHQRAIETATKEYANHEGAEDEEEEVEALSKFSQTLKDIDTQMRELVDYLFDSNVSEICGADGSMYDMLDGKFRFEHIMDTLLPLYNESYRSEARKMRARLALKTEQFTGHKPTTKRKSK